MFSRILSLYAPLFILMDFIGTIPVFLSLTQQATGKERVRVAVLSTLVAGAIVLAFAVGGRGLQSYFGLSVEAIKAGGGMLLLYIAFHMIFAGSATQVGNDGTDLKNIIVSPLAIPMLAGPGSITYAMVSSLELHGTDQLYLLAAIGMAVVGGTIVLAASALLHRLLGAEFTRGLEKMTAVVVSFIALEMILSAIRSYLFV